MSHTIVRRLRPYLSPRYKSIHRPTPTISRRTSQQASSPPAKESTNDYKRRLTQLTSTTTHPTLSHCYPLLDPSTKREWLTIPAFKAQYRGLLRANEHKPSTNVIVGGRIQAVRTAGSKLVFLDLKRDEDTLQVLVQFDKLRSDARGAGDLPTFKEFSRLVRRGDWWSVRGWPYRSPSGELSVLAQDLPTLLAPSLHQIPSVLEDAETIARYRHVDMLVNPSAIQTLRLRSLLKQILNDFFARDGFTKVNTPILSAGAGGAIARPFATQATELEGQTLHLRIAPELWLKRLIVGGMDKVYEIGPAFRNEGVDATHNPEFTTCEFYEAFATLGELMGKTERLLAVLAKGMEGARERLFPDLRGAAAEEMGVKFTSPFRRLEFIPTLQRALDTTLPDLAPENAEQAMADLRALFQSKDLPIPPNPTLPRLLDALATHFIEPLCQQPTFITHHPVALSPLSKSMTCPRTGQQVSLRAELFIRGVEYANMYEEENSPFTQRANFAAQKALRGSAATQSEAVGDADADGEVEVDEAYLQALEWGLPPTGGWGCGIDRLVMLFSARGRIGDVLPFGSVRNVVGLSKGWAAEGGEKTGSEGKE